MNVASQLKWSIKNLLGPSTRRKLVAISVDDYGVQRIASFKARERLKAAGLPIESNRFDMLDSLETPQDLEALFEALNSVKDVNGNPAVFTPFAVAGNPNFEQMREEGYTRYIFESVADTYQKISGYGNCLNLIKEGIDKRIFLPQYHGREHLNVKVVMELLDRKDAHILACFQNFSLGALKATSKNVSWTAAFQFEHLSENHTLAEIAQDGARQFENIYGYKATHFTSPGNRGSVRIEKALSEVGIKYIDTDLVKREHLGNGIYKKQYNFNGKLNELGQRYIIRNCVFEPLLNESDPYGTTLKQIENAFLFGKVANISTHRVNFSGNIDPENRRKGLKNLKGLLQAIKKRWPNVEFISTDRIIPILLKEQ